MKIEPRGQTVLVEGIQLTSAVDRDKEARLQAETIPAGAREAWLYGPALGDLVRVLLERPELERLHVVVMNRKLSTAVGMPFLLDPVHELVVLSRWPDPRVVMHQPGELEYVCGPWVVSPAELLFAEAAALPLRDRLQALINEPYHELMFRTLAPVWAAQEEVNRPLLESDPHVSALFGDDEPEAIVIGGGPTTAEYFDFIRERAAAVPVIAASSVLRPLLAADIVPDVVVVVDRLPAMLDHFPEDLEAPGTHLLYNAQVLPAIPRRWKGPRCWMREGDLFVGGSVMHAQVDLAVRMGARTVHLFGVDLSYPGEHTHLDGAPAASRVTGPRSRTINGLGGWVPTDDALAQYHRALESYIAVHQDVRFLKYGRAGAAVLGAEWVDARRVA